MFDGLILVENCLFSFVSHRSQVDIIHYNLKENNNETSRPLCRDVTHSGIILLKT